MQRNALSDLWRRAGRPPTEDHIYRPPLSTFPCEKIDHDHGRNPPRTLLNSLARLSVDGDRPGRPTFHRKPKTTSIDLICGKIDHDHERNPPKPLLNSHGSVVCPSTGRPVKKSNDNDTYLPTTNTTATPPKPKPKAQSQRPEPKQTLTSTMADIGIR